MRAERILMTIVLSGESMANFIPSRLPFFWLVQLVLLMLAVGGTSQLSAGDIKGRVVLKRNDKPGAEIISRSIIRRYINKRVRRDAEQAQERTPEIVVYLEGDFGTHTNHSRQKVVLDQKQKRFIPHVLPILVGTTVDFLNSDDVYHNVFSFSPARSFDLGRYRKGKSRSVTFDTPGVVKVYCDIHTHMNAFILVLENPYFTTTDEDGNYVLENVPPGEYTLKAWHGRWPEKSRRVVVRQDSETIVDFEFP